MFQRTTAINKLKKLSKRVRIIQGGTSAGKTFGIIPILIDEACKKSGLEISITSGTLPQIKRGALRDFKKIMKLTGRWIDNNWHGSDLIYTFSNGSYIEFFSIDQEDKVRGARRDVLYVNECNRIKFETYHQLAVRTRKDIWLDFNPTAEFWVNTEIEGDSDSEKIILTYKDNDALEKSIVSEIEKAKYKAFYEPELKNPFIEPNIKNGYWANWWKVYGLGLVGKLEGAIFDNWDIGEFDETLPFVYGLDFGVKDPDALIRVAVDKKNKSLYWDECVYQNGLSTDALAAAIKTEYVNGKLIVADSQASRTIIDLKKKNLHIKPVKKNKIVEDIKTIQSYTIIVTERSVNLQKELRQYIWLDKKGEIPIDEFNHAIDAARYASQTLITPIKRTKQRVA